MYSSFTDFRLFLKVRETVLLIYVFVNLLFYEIEFLHNINESPLIKWCHRKISVLALFPEVFRTYLSETYLALKIDFDSLHAEVKFFNIGS